MGLKLVVFTSGYSLFYCPACKDTHAISVAPGSWSYNGNPNLPTTEPSIRVSGKEDENGGWITTCHCYLTDGRIRFCADSPHEFAGQTIDLPDFPQGILTSKQLEDVPDAKGSTLESSPPVEA